MSDRGPDAPPGVMTWLTREWHRGELSDAEYEARIEQCRAHHEALLPRLPHGLRLFAGEPDDLGYISLHDAQVDWWALDEPRSLTLEMLCWTNDVRHRRLVIQYCGRVELLGAGEGELHRWLGDARTEFLYGEVDVVDDDRFEHRHLLWPHGEFGVRFENVAVISVRQSERAAREWWRRRAFESSSAFGHLVRAHEAWGSLRRGFRRRVSDLGYVLEQLLHRDEEK